MKTQEFNLKCVWKLFGQQRKLQGKTSVKSTLFFKTIHEGDGSVFHLPALNYGYQKKKVWLIVVTHPY